MDIDLLNYLWDAHQQKRLHEHERELNRSNEKLSDADGRIRALLAEQRQLRGIVRALATVLIDRGLISKDQLAELVDTTSAALLAERSHLCHGCERPLRTVNLRCIYCGEPAPRTQADAEDDGQTPG